MSQKASSDFIGQLAVNAAIRDELAAALAGAPDRPASLARMVGFAAQHGFEVTADELAQFVSAAEDASELTDDQLAQVAGGMEIRSFSRLLYSAPPWTHSTDCSL